jgi:hypothetical protein
MVQLVEVHVVGAEATQRPVDGVEDVLARETPVPRVWTHGSEALGGDDEVAAPPLQPAPEDLLGPPHRVVTAGVRGLRVDVGRVEERDAGVRRAIEDGPGGPFVALKAERHGPQAEA